MDFNDLDPIAYDSISFSSELSKLPAGGYEARTDINGKILTAQGATESEAALALDEVVEQATTAGEISFGGY